MEFINFVIDENSFKSTCFLCFKVNENNTNIYEDFVIEDEYFTLNVSLVNIMKNMFPANEPLLGQACDNCTNILLKMFILLHRNDIKKVAIEQLVERTLSEMDNHIFDKNRKKLQLKLNLPTNHSIFDKNYVTSDKKNKHKTCTNCNMKFTTKKDLQDHMKVAHKNSNSAILCDVCGKSCKTQNTLKSHLNSHILKQCPHCLKSLKNHSHLKVHVDNHIKKIRRKRVRHYMNCNSCSFKTVNKSSLEAHINKQHLHVRPYVCLICSKAFYRKSNLTEHEQTHENTKEFTCDICGENFVSKKTLANHIDLHKGEKCFPCNICGLTFINSGRRTQHMKRKHTEKAKVQNKVL